MGYINLSSWWLLWQLLGQMWFCCWDKSAYFLAPRMLAEGFFFCTWQGQQLPSQLCLRVLSALQPYVRTLIALFIPQAIKGEMTQLEEK